MMENEVPVKGLSRSEKIVDFIIDPVISLGQKIMNEELSKDRVED